MRLYRPPCAIAGTLESKIVAAMQQERCKAGTYLLVVVLLPVRISARSASLSVIANTAAATQQKTSDCDDLKKSSRYSQKHCGIVALAIIMARPIPMVGWFVLVPDYIAIGVLIVCIVWVVADWIPRDKL
jgi:hypothetical protein